MAILVVLTIQEDPRRPILPQDLSSNRVDTHFGPDRASTGTTRDTGLTFDRDRQSNDSYASQLCTKAGGSPTSPKTRINSSCRTYLATGVHSLLHPAWDMKKCQMVSDLSTLYRIARGWISYKQACHEQPSQTRTPQPCLVAGHARRPRGEASEPGRCTPSVVLRVLPPYLIYAHHHLIILPLQLSYARHHHLFLSVQW